MRRRGGPPPGGSSSGRTRSPRPSPAPPRREPKTQARVIAFQKQAKLAPDGIVGPKTTKSLVASVLADN
ncbi:MAG: peptidoglycan-binding protein, partial [Acidobacteriia bacterium]|nr:peptidoglycan-binding protein [Terriglobia bacterium]